MKSFFKNISISMIMVLALFLPFFANSQGGPIPPNPPPDTRIVGTIRNPFNCGGAANCTLIDLITAILRNIIMPIAAVGVTVWIIWAGFGFLMAQGNPSKLEVARQRLLWSLIGAGILLGAVGISAVVQNTVRALLAP